jgi:hypothetical protein
VGALPNIIISIPANFVIIIQNYINMRLKPKNQSDENGRTILVIADCLHGVMEAGRFAVRNLYDSNSRILLMQSYQKPRYGQSMLRNITPMLEKIAKEELTKLKNEMFKESGLPAGSIGKLALEGELSTLLRSWFGDTPGLSVVVGYDPRLSYRAFPCRSVIKAVTDSGLRPLFIVSDSITLIDNRIITLFTEDERQVCSDYLDFLEDMSDNHAMRMTTLTMGKAGKFRPAPETTQHFSAWADSRTDNLTAGEVLFRQEVQKISVG